MAKKLSIRLSEDSIQSAIDELNKYKDEFIDKNELFVRRLSEVGIPIIDANIMAAQGDSDKSHRTYIEIYSSGYYSQATLFVEGQDVLFVEFGSGVHYNGEAGTSPHPKGKEFGYTIGSYGQGKGKQNTWGYYDDGGDLILTHGTEATMPVYRASVEIMQNIRKIAKEVFGN